MDFFKTEEGRIIFSAILGLGLATLFKHACKQNCRIYVAPKPLDIKNQIYKNGEDCFIYHKVKSPCNLNPIQER